jgi:hypothetical protein
VAQKSSGIQEIKGVKIMMGALMSGLFGKPKAPKVVQPTPVTQVTANVGDEQKQQLLQMLAKRRRATLMSALTDPNIARRKLGAG